MNPQLIDFVQFALSQHDRAGTRRIIEWICSRYGAYCGIFWQQVQGADPVLLYTAAAWFKTEERWSRHDLPLASLTGRVMETGETAIATEENPLINHQTSFFRNHGIHTVCCVSTGQRGTLKRNRSAPYRWSSERKG